MLQKRCGVNTMAYNNTEIYKVNYLKKAEKDYDEILK